LVFVTEMNMDFTIRHEEEKDIDQVRAIVCAAFPSEAESKLVDALRVNGKATISLVAVNGEDVVGHILFSPVSLSPAPLNDPKGIGLAPVAVRPDVQLQGIGSRLIREGLRLCKEQGFDYCVVLGDPNYYGRFGFEKASRFNVQNEYGEDDPFMVIRFSDQPVSGLAKYADEFAMFSV
jgi:putative acetyltransferase